MNAESVVIRYLGRQDYQTCLQAMQHFTNQRDETSTDEIWILEHNSVFTQGQNGKPEHILNPGNIPVIQVDRGGQVTYHGPGQLVAYTLIDLKRKKFNIRELVTHLENSIINLLDSYGIKARARCEAPGVYIAQQKIASIGLRIRRGCSYHGLAFNINMDLEPFSRINPCGFANLQITQLANFIEQIELKKVSEKLITYLFSNLGYNSFITKTTPIKN